MLEIVLDIVLDNIVLDTVGHIVLDTSQAQATVVAMSFELSNDAPQLSLSLNALCGIHAERHFRKFITVSDGIRLELDHVRHAIWSI